MQRTLSSKTSPPTGSKITSAPAPPVISLTALPEASGDIDDRVRPVGIGEHFQLSRLRPTRR